MPDLHGAIVLNRQSGDLEGGKPGFVLSVPEVQRVTTKRHRFALRGDVMDGYFCSIDGIAEVGPFPTPERATDYAKMYAGVMERAS